MTSRHFHLMFKILLIVAWIGCVLGVYAYMQHHDIHLRQVPRMVRQDVLQAGALGPVVFVGIYIASTIFLFSKGGLDILAGAIYGPFVGSLIVLVGLNLAGIITFWFGRYIGRRFVQKYERGWIKKYDDILQEEGFLTVFFMRLLFFPFDLVSLGCGASRISFRQFFWGTLFGSIPVTVMWVALGGAFDNPRKWGLFIILFVLAVGLALWLRRLPWVKKKLYKERG